MINANPYPTYEEALSDYLAKLHTLMQLPQESETGKALSAVEFPAESLVRHSAEIADISAAMIQHAQAHLNSVSHSVREGIRCHFIDQATVELLLGIELLQISEEQQTGNAPTAASRATRSAALQEAVCAANKSSSVPLSQGIPTEGSYRATESATLDEAASALKLAATGMVSSIGHRVQELGKDIAFDLMADAQGIEDFKSVVLSTAEIAELLGSINKGAGDSLPRPAAVAILFNVYEKVLALLDKDIEALARSNIGEWLDKIKQANKIEIFDSLVENLYRIEALETSMGIGHPVQVIESVNKAADLVKTFSDKFVILIGRMRKLEDAIRLGKLIQTPQLQRTITALQVALLAALVHSGYGYINKDLAGILREKGFLA